MKKCRVCGEQKSLMEFYRDCSKRDAHATICKECDKERMRAYYLSHSSEIKSRAARWHKENFLKKTERMNRWVKENRAISNAIKKRWEKNNPEKVSILRGIRRRIKHNATPRWANGFFMSEAYRLAELRTKMFGYSWQVDHIVPLQSPLVCGLHVHNNLQVIPSTANNKKGNRYWPDMPGTI